ncbi:MAG TPA: insulinase family protein, partial [Gemmatimonadota bacterium]|nr:insulinase family protein [Gemmatimonadota bacterium]
MRRAASVLGLAALVALPAGLAGQQGGGFPDQPPPPLPSHAVRFPSIGRDTLANGLRLVVVENHEQPVVSARLYLPAGGDQAPDGQEGLADMTASLLRKGTTTRSAAEIASTVEGVGASLNAGADDDYTYVTATSLTRDLPTVLQVLADVVRHPTFPQGEVETMRKRQLSALQVQLSQPSVLASRAFHAEVYGDHPYGDVETQASLRAITRQDMVAFHRSHYVPQGGLLVFAGDIDLEAARAAARKWFGDWSGSRPAAPAMPSPPAPGPTSITLVHRPGSVQSDIWVGNLGIRPSSPDAVPLDVMNRVLGGGANSRLFLILREQKGWTYGAYSRVSSPEDLGYFAATAETRTPVTDSALAEMMHQLRRIRTEAVPDSELRAAETYLTGHFPIQIETPEQVASQVADVVLKGLGVSWLERYRARVDSVTAADVQRVARAHVHPDSATIVVVGDAAKLRDGLQAIAPVHMQDADGKPLQPSDLEARKSNVSLDVTRARMGTFDYNLVVQGKPFGTYTLTLAGVEGKDAWTLEEDLEGAMGSQKGTYTFHKNLTPVSSRQEGVTTRDLTYADGHVSGTATVASPQGQPQQQEVDEDIPRGTLDAGASAAIVLAAPLAPDSGFSVPVFAPGQGVQTMTGVVVGQDSVTVPAGTYDVFKVEASGQGGFKLMFYVTRKAPHVLVKQEFEGR